MLVIIIAILLLTNIATLAVFLVNKPADKPGATTRKTRMTAYLKNDLGFSGEQLASYDTLYKEQMTGVDSLMDGIRQEKQNRFKFLVANSFSDSAINIAGTTMADKQKILEIKMLWHLRNVRAIGTPAQQNKFDTTFFRIMSRKKEGHP
jgi:Spy/CpxP family protein refolding chaperone